MSNIYNNRKKISLRATALVIASMTMAFQGCKRQSQGDTTDSTAQDRAMPTLTSLPKNKLSNSSGSFIASQASSPVHWQPWSPEVFELAKQSRRTVFAIIGQGTDPRNIDLLNRISRSPATCNMLNKNHVNVIIDTNIHHSMGTHAVRLCAQTNSKPTTPIMVWFSYEGKALSWTPVIKSRTSDVTEHLTVMCRTVIQLWNDSSQYVIENSRRDYKRRAARIQPTVPEAANATHVIHELASLYDPTSHNIDQLGNSSTAKFVLMLTKAATSGALTDSQRTRYAGIASLAAEQILIQGLIDPVDGGLWDGKQHNTTALPVFAKSLHIQVEAMEALFSLYQLTEDEIYLHAAQKLYNYTEQNLKQPNGDYSEGIVYGLNQPTDNACLWTLEELEQLLTEQELRICKLAFGIRGLGNIPLIDDRNRTYFRKNTLTWKITLQELASKTQMQVGDIQSVLQTMTKKLARARNDKSPPILKENLTTAKSMAQYASALVAAYRATGKSEYLDQAKQIFNHTRTQFSKDGQLKEARYAGKTISVNASAKTKTNLCTAALDLLDATQDGKYLEIALQIHLDTMQTHSKDDLTIISEQDYSGFPTEYTITQPFAFPILNSDSTMALVWSNATRILLRKNNPKIREQADQLKKTLNGYASSFPRMSIDYLVQHSLINQPQVHAQSPFAAKLAATAVHRPCHIIGITPENAPNHPLINTTPEKGSVTVIFGEENLGSTNNPSELRNWLK